MALKTKADGGGESLTFANAPRYEQNGKTHIEDDAFDELADRMAARYAELLDRLAEE